MSGEDAAKEAGACGGPDCEEKVDRLFAFLDHELATADEAEVRAHIEECRPCLDEVTVDQVLKNLVRRCCQEEAPVDLRVRIRAQLTTLRVETTR
ncbi:mycothiol system anti-sigma-R factor [Cellulomonas denverensis]|uniref:Mycothiol system anti-sigma-R factor n=1 Tax=Cellulomonas denverensis TaxID=264297 RepID=A0A7X6KUY8_9CELL|nr:mycothiol system anti-sigma-R factor [Cellulomonas denverensis]NKY22575.1 mycothiol system anti-sigma-R factor [Cellulomonas denverensis]GIG24780.1 anti-sigma factor RsrA [Cellulomonas denverensis]